MNDKGPIPEKGRVVFLQREEPVDVLGREGVAVDSAILARQIAYLATR